jgi:hypothetical protein
MSDEIEADRYRAFALLILGLVGIACAVAALTWVVT